MYRMTAIALALILGMSFAATQQHVIRRIEGGKPGKGEKKIMIKDGDVFNLPEVGALILPEDGNLVVMEVMEGPERPEGYGKVDLRKDDIIQMVEGKPVKTIKDLKEAYEKTAVGAAFRMGVKREDRMTIVSLEKGDPEKMPKIRRMIRMGDDGPGGPEVREKTMAGIRALGLMLTNTEENVVVAEVMPEAPKEVREAGIAEGDKITAINGKSFKSMREFMDILRDVPVGSQVNVEALHGGRKHTFSFTKEEMKRREVIRKD